MGTDLQLDCGEDWLSSRAAQSGVTLGSQSWRVDDFKPLAPLSQNDCFSTTSFCL